MAFESIPLSCHYDSDNVDVLQEFYRPLLKSAKRYDRAVGYFSSSTFRTCSAELATFIGNNGQIRLIIGCLTQTADIQALEGLSEKVHEEERQYLRDQVQKYLLELVAADPRAAGTFAQLVGAGVAQIKFAIRDVGIYHEKMGIFEDELGIKVAFIGSLNETAAAMSHGFNHESISVYQSLDAEIYARYGDTLEQRFDSLWKGKANKTRIYDLDAHSLTLIKNVANKTRDVEQEPVFTVYEALPEKFTLRPYQNEAIVAWQNNRLHGILAMATGTGKTLTAIDAIKRFRDKVKGGVVIVTVPLQNLAIQWVDALHLQGIETISVFDGFVGWYETVTNLFMATLYSDAVDIPCLVCVNKTFKGEQFQELLSILNGARQKNNLIIVDECHHFNGDEAIKKLPTHFNLRLGLSATPYDQFDEHADDRHLDKYFHSIVYEFPLGKAIEEGFLTKYKFHIFCCTLNAEETDLYEGLTRKIVSIAGGEDKISAEVWAQVQPYMLARARIVGAAESKLATLKAHLQEIGVKPYTLFYCGDGSVVEGDTRQRQVEAVSETLHELGWNSSRITAIESLKVREELLDRLRTRSIDAVVSIKVLDEGIDVPVCQRAYLLASQSSDRQGVQRRGRILRRSPGKEQADLYDFLVIRGATGAAMFSNLAKKELRRAYQFAKDATNRQEIVTQLELIQQSIGLTPGDPND